MTFVIREIEALTNAGYKIDTVSRGWPRKCSISTESLKFCETGLYLDTVSLLAKLYAQLKVIGLKPGQWFNLVLLILSEKEFRGVRDLPRSFYHFLEAGYLYTRLRIAGISHIHAHILNAPTSIALFLSRYLDVPFSFTMHGSQIYVDPLMLKTKLHLCKRAVTVSEFNRNFLLQKYGGEFSQKIKVIHCGIDLSVFTPKTVRKANPTAILAVGRLAEVKGFGYLVEAASLLKKKGVAFECRIVGEGDELDNLKRMSAASDVDDVVSFLGGQPQEQVKKLLEEASIFALPCIVCDDGTREGLPVALMEAMAMELAVVSTKTVGIPELIEDKKEGLLVEQRNPVELASALESLLRNPALCRELGRNGRAKIMREFNIANIPEQFYNIFN
jgi:glycosyltransferase involved in cell wall biosynthesis